MGQALNKKTKPKKERSILFGIIFVLLIIYLLTLIIPFTWAIITSLKSRIDYLDNPFGLPKKIQLNNFVVAMENFTALKIKDGGTKTVYIEEMLINSLIYSIGGSFLATLSTCLMSYASARYKYKIGKIIYAIVIITMSLPIVGSLPSAIQITKAFKLYDTYYGLLILQLGFRGIHFLIFYEVFRSIPKDYSEAAFMDGANNFKTMTRVMLPITRSTFFTIMLIKFVGLWNDYNITLEYMPNIKTLAYGLYEYSSSYAKEISSVPMKLAGCLVLALPIVVIFLLFHDRIMGNYTQGGIKG